MKLAEALLERAEIKKQLYLLTTQMKQNAKVQEGDEPEANVERLCAKYDALMEKYTDLVLRISRTNNETVIDDGPLNQLLIRRDSLSSKIGVYRNLYEETLMKNERFRRNEIKYVLTIKASKVLEIIDELSKEYRLLDNEIQRINWTVDLYDFNI